MSHTISQPSDSCAVVDQTVNLNRPARQPRAFVKRSRFSSKGKSTDTIYNVVDHESNPSHYQLSGDILVIHRRNTSYKTLQHWLTHLLHCILAETHVSSSESL
jgi:hypothetical protein